MVRPVVNHRTATPSEETKHLQNKILELKRDGMNYAQIGVELGYSDTYIKKLYKKALNAIIVENVKDVRKMELLRLEALEREAIDILRSFHPVVNSGSVVRDVVDGPDGRPLQDTETGAPVTVRLQDHGPRLAAMDRALKVMERRARLLGLDAPNKTALTDPEGERSVLPLSPASLKSMESDELQTLLNLLKKAKAEAPQSDEAES